MGCRFSEISQRFSTVTDGGSTHPGPIQEVPNFAKRAHGELQVIIHTAFTVISGYDLGHNSEKLLGFGALHFDLPEVDMPITYTSTGGP